MTIALLPALVAPTAAARDSYSTRIDGVTFECEKLAADEIKEPPELAPAPPGAARPEVEKKPRICRDGYGPLPIKHDGGPVRVQKDGRMGAAVPPQNQAPDCVTGPPAGCYYYAGQRRTVCDNAGVYTMTAFMTQHNPFARTSQPDHSIGQLWAIDTNCGATPNYSTVEIGWRKTGVDSGPRLFVFRFDNGIPRCYIGQYGCSDPGWVQYAAAVEVPGQLIGYADPGSHMYEILVCV